MKRWRIYLSWAGTVMLAFTAGYSIAPSHPSGLAGDHAHQTVPPKETSVGPQTFTLGQRETVVAGERALSDQMQARVFDVLYQPNQLQRQKQLAALLDGVTADNWQALIDGFLAQTIHTGRRHDKEWALALEQAGAVGGSAAVERFLNDPLGASVFNAGTCLQSWAARNPQDAIAWFRNAPENGAKQQIAGWLVHGLAQNSLEAAQAFVESFPQGMRHSFADELVSGVLQHDGIQGAKTFISRLARSTNADPNLTRAVFGQVADRMFHAHWLSGNPEGACSWVAEHIKESYVTPSVIQHAAGDYAIKNPAAALEWLRTTVAESNPAMLEAGVAGVMQRWGDNTKLASWLETNRDHALHDRVVMHYARRLGAMDPSAAQQWIGTIQDGNTRSQALVELEAQKQQGR